jgi:hypothetical protein
MEHRWGQRMPCKARVRLIAGGSLTGSGRMRDISSSGAFIETVLELPVNTRLILFVWGNESATHEVEVAASVVRTERGGLGIEWCETPAGSVCARVGCTKGCASLDRNRT